MKYKHRYLNLFETKIYICNFIVSYIPSHKIRILYYRNIMKFAIKKGSSIHMGCKFNSLGNFSIGANSTINQYCRIDNRGEIIIGDNVSISPYTKLITADHDINHPEFIGRERPIIIEDFAFIGADAMLLGGSKMCKGSVLGAKSLLNKAIEPFSIYAGIPASYRGQRKCDALLYQTRYDRWLH